MRPLGLGYVEGITHDYKRHGTTRFSGSRVAVHLAAALWAIRGLGDLPPIRVGEHIASLGIAGNLLAPLVSYDGRSQFGQYFEIGIPLCVSLSVL